MAKSQKTEFLEWLRKQELESNRKTIQFLMNETASIIDEKITLADGITVVWHTDKWPQWFEVKDGEDVYKYRNLDSVKLGIRDIRRQRL